MSDKDRISSLYRAMYGHATTYYDNSTSLTEGQDNFLDSMFPSSHASRVENNVDSVIDLLNVWKQQLNDNVEAMKELYHQRQSMMAKPNIENSAQMCGTFLPLTELGFGGSDVNAFQDHLSQGLGLRRTSTLDAAGPPVSMKVAEQHHAWAALSHNMQTSMTETGYESLPCGEVARHHGKRIFTPAHTTSLQSINLDFGHAPEIGFSSAGSCLPRQTLSPASLTYTSDNRGDHARSSASAPPRNETVGPTVLSFMSSGIKHYRCECGYESSRKRDVDHHLESLQHSERKYECSCGQKFTRYDSLDRHRKKKIQKSMGSRA